MSNFKHITKNEFFKLLEKRLRSYEQAIAGNMGGALYTHIYQVCMSHIRKIESLNREVNLFGSGFWGYGINSICDGKVSHSQLDVENIKKIPDLNKHHSEYRLFWLLIFKVENESLYISTFCIDTCDFKNLISITNDKHDLKNLENARLRTQEGKIFVDFVFNNLIKPIYFQLDTNISGYEGSRESLAKYYISEIKRLTDEVKGSSKPKLIIENTSFQELNRQIDKIEIELRKLISKTLIKERKSENFEILLSGETKSTIKRRINQHIEKHPNKTFEEFKPINYSIQFFDIEHLRKCILNDHNWMHFKNQFKDQKKVEKYFDQFSEVRHVLKHSREMTELVQFEGKASIAWFQMILGLN